MPVLSKENQGLFRWMIGLLVLTVGGIFGYEYFEGKTKKKPDGNGSNNGPVKPKLTVDQINNGALHDKKITIGVPEKPGEITPDDIDDKTKTKYYFAMTTYLTSTLYVVYSDTIQPMAPKLIYSSDAGYAIVDDNDNFLSPTFDPKTKDANRYNMTAYESQSNNIYEFQDIKVISDTKFSAYLSVRYQTANPLYPQQFTPGVGSDLVAKGQVWSQPSKGKAQVLIFNIKN